MALTLNVVDACRIQSAHAAVHRNGQIVAHTAGQLVHSLLQLLRKGKIRHGLQHIIQRPHRVPLDGILRHVGNKNQQHIAVQRADAAGGLHAVQMRHLNIKKNNVVDRTVFLKDLNAACKGRNLKRCTVLPCIALHIACQLLPDGGLVFHDRNAGHPQHLLLAGIAPGHRCITPVPVRCAVMPGYFFLLLV